MSKVRFVLLVSCALCAPLAGAQGPTVQSVPGAAISMLRGPTGFADEHGYRGPALVVERIAVRVELHPDVARVEHTYAIRNPGARVTTSVGVRQQNPEVGDAKVVHCLRPLAAVAWLDGARLPEEAVRHEPSFKDGAEDGYTLGVTATFPAGSSVLSLTTVLQTSASELANGGMKPTGAGDARFAFQSNHYSWSWTPGQDLPEPPTVFAIRMTGGVGLPLLRAEEWTDGAVSDGSALYWTRAPSLVLRYSPPHGAHRANTRDDLASLTRLLVERPPTGSFPVPEMATAVERPGDPPTLLPPDEARARRALIVPASLMSFVLLGAWLWLRRRTRA